MEYVNANDIRSFFSSNSDELDSDNDLVYLGDDADNLYDSSTFVLISEEISTQVDHSYSKEASIAILPVRSSENVWYPAAMDTCKYELPDLKQTDFVSLPVVEVQKPVDDDINIIHPSPDASTIEIQISLAALHLSKQEVCLTIEQYLCNRPGLFPEHGHEPDSWCIQVMLGMLHSKFLLNVCFADHNDSCTVSSRYVSGSENFWYSVFQEVCDLFRTGPGYRLDSVRLDADCMETTESNLKFFSQPANIGLMEEVVECVLDPDLDCQINSLQQICDLSLDPEMHSLLFGKGAVDRLLQVICTSVRFSESGGVIADTHLIRLLAYGLSSLENFIDHGPAQTVIVQSEQLRKVLNCCRTSDRLRCADDMVVVVLRVSEKLWRKIVSLTGPSV